jgi:hypothetical protein
MPGTRSGRTSPAAPRKAVAALTGLPGSGVLQAPEPHRALPPAMKVFGGSGVQAPTALKVQAEAPGPG